MASVTLVFFTLNSFGPLPSASAQLANLPSMVALSPSFSPAILKGIKVNPDNPFQFEFILDKGNSDFSGQQLENESSRLIKYFLAAITVPEKDLWVNLSPYEKDRIVPDSFGQTEMGRDLLAQDYLLKQITSSLMFPDSETGKKFWEKIRSEAMKQFGTAEIPVDTFNKVWIVPEKAVVYENAQAGTAFVVETRLKVMLEEDYIALEKHVSLRGGKADEAIPTSEIASSLKSAPRNDTTQIIREVIIPELTREINEGQNFAQLRQVYNSLILATWYKKKIKDSILNQVYADQNKVVGVEYVNSVIARSEATKQSQDDEIASPSARNDKELIYEQYLEAFKQGAYDYIKEEYDPTTQSVIPRKYFSGGVEFGSALDFAMSITAQPPLLNPSSDMAMVRVDVKPANTADQAMTQDEEVLDFIEKWQEKNGSRFMENNRHELKEDVYRRMEGIFSIQYNPRRERSEPTEPIANYRQFDPSKPNYNHISADQVIDETVINGIKTTVIVNNRPYFEGHHVWIPDISKSLPQFIDAKKWIVLALTIMNNSHRSNFKMFYNSGGAGGSINQLHFHGFYYGGNELKSDLWNKGLMPIEKSDREEVVEFNGVTVSKINKFPAHGLSFSGGSIEDRSVEIFKYLNILNAQNIAYQIFFTKKEAIVMPRYDASRAIFKEGVYNFGGEIIAYNQKFFDELTEEEIKREAEYKTIPKTVFDKTIEEYKLKEITAATHPAAGENSAASPDQAMASKNENLREGYLFEVRKKEGENALKYSYLKLGKMDVVNELSIKLTERIKKDLGLSPDSINNNDWLVINIGGFGVPNSAFLLARNIAHTFNLKHVMFDRSLQLPHPSKSRHYATLKTKAERQALVEDRLGNINEGDVRGKNILLVDDGIVTGAVIQEASRVLNKLGVTSIHAYAVARMINEDAGFLEEDINQAALQLDRVGVLANLLVNNQIYTTNLLKNSFQLDSEKFRELLSMLGRTTKFNLYFYAIEYFGSDQPDNMDILSNILFDESGLKLPLAATLRNIHSDEFYKEIANTIKDYNYFIPDSAIGDILVRFGKLLTEFAATDKQVHSNKALEKDPAHPAETGSVERDQAMVNAAAFLNHLKEQYPWLEYSQSKHPLSSQPETHSGFENEVWVEADGIHYIKQRKRTDFEDILNEIYILASLKGEPNIPQIEEMGIGDDGLVWFKATAIKKARDLSVTNWPSLNYSQWMASLLEIGSQIKMLHQKGIAPRDIKLLNALRNDDGEIQLIDFGSANKLSDLSDDEKKESLFEDAKYFARTIDDTLIDFGKTQNPPWQKTFENIQSRLPTVHRIKDANLTELKTAFISPEQLFDQILNELEANKDNVDVWINENSADGAMISIDEPQLSNNNPYAESLRNLVVNNTTADSQKRFNILKEIGPEIEKFMREYFNEPELKIMIVPAGSTLKGYADSTSDIEYMIHILNGTLKEISKRDTRDDISAALKKTGYIYYQVNRMIELKGYPSEELNIAMGQLWNLNTNNASILPYLYMPAAYGDKDLIEKLREKTIADMTDERWEEIRRNYSENIDMSESYVERTKNNLLNWLTQLGINDINQLKKFQRKRELPSLSVMKSIYETTQIGNSESSKVEIADGAMNAIKAVRQVIDVRLDKTVVKKWVGGFPEKQRNGAQFIADHIRYVPNAEFEAALYASMIDFKSKMKQPFFVFVNDGDKSNAWIFNLINEMGLFKSLEKLEYSQQGGDYLESKDDDEGRSRRKIRDSGVKDILIVDDGSFTGSQLEMTLANFSELDVTIHIVIPYMTNHAENYLKKKKNVVIYHHENIPTIDEIISGETPVLRKSVEDILYSPAWPSVDKYMQDHVLFYFQHKISDAMALYSGDLNVLGLNIVPPYKDNYLSWVKERTDESLNVKDVGGIDFTAEKTPLEIRYGSPSTRPDGLAQDEPFRFNPAQLEQLRNAPGFVPVIINIQPLTNLPLFLGINKVEAPSEEIASAAAS